MRPARIVASSLIAIAAGTATPAVAAEYFVAQGDKACSDTGPGVETQPWCTLQKAADTLVAGDTVWVKQGVYRESVMPKNEGTANARIRYAAVAGEKVVISGADPIVGWKVCTSSECPNAPTPAQVYYAEVDWDVPQLFEQGESLERARMPFDDYWVAEGGGMTTVIDTKHLCPDCLPGLTQTADTWNGATLVFWKHDMGIHSFRKVIGFDPAQSVVTLDDVIYSDWVVEGGVDSYYLENHLAALDRAGQWVMAEGLTPKRVFLWPKAGSDPNALLIEGSRRDRFIIEYGTKGYLTFEGFEIAQGAGHGIGDWNTPYPEGIQILRNKIHDNGGTGVYLRDTPHALVQDNDIYANEIGLSGGPDSTIDHNQIRSNRIDGLWPGDHALITRNVIAHHNNLNHPDNIQTCCGASSGMVFDGNLILNGGQCFMLEQTTDSVVRNNVILGSGAYCLIFGDNTVNRWDVVQNTFGLTGYGAVRMEGTGYKLENNIFFTAGTSSAFAAPETGLTSDYNLFFNPATAERGVVNFKGETYGSSVSRPFSDYQKLSGYDQHSAEAEPQLVNYPTCMAQGGSSAIDSVTTLDNDDCFAPGDHIELGFDGVVRTVESVTVDPQTKEPTIKFSPVLSRRIWKSFLVLNWKAGTNTQIDVTPKESSPACHMSSTGSYVGAIPCLGTADAGVAPWMDGGTLPDSSVPGQAQEPGGSDGGCGCRMGPTRSAAGVGWMIALGLLIRARRRVAHCSACSRSKPRTKC